MMKLCMMKPDMMTTQAGCVCVSRSAIDIKVPRNTQSS
jgi:hypothetical protein